MRKVFSDVNAMQQRAHKLLDIAMDLLVKKQLQHSLVRRRLHAEDGCCINTGSMTADNRVESCSNQTHAGKKKYFSSHACLFTRVRILLDCKSVHRSIGTNLGAVGCGH